jgi:hypothetical protein
VILILRILSCHEHQITNLTEKNRFALNKDNKNILMLRNGKNTVVKVVTLEFTYQSCKGIIFLELGIKHTLQALGLKRMHAWFSMRDIELLFLL